MCQHNWYMVAAVRYQLLIWLWITTTTTIKTLQLKHLADPSHGRHTSLPRPKVRSTISDKFAVSKSIAGHTVFANLFLEFCAYHVFVSNSAFIFAFASVLHTLRCAQYFYRSLHIKCLSYSFVQVPCGWSSRKVSFHTKWNAHTNPRFTTALSHLLSSSSSTPFDEYHSVYQQIFITTATHSYESSVKYSKNSCIRIELDDDARRCVQSIPLFMHFLCMHIAHSMLWQYVAHLTSHNLEY